MDARSFLRSSTVSLAYIAYFVGMLFIPVLGVYQRSKFPPYPFLEPDSWGYLGFAMHYLVEGKFIHVYGRSLIPYPSFVLLMLYLFRDFHAIPLAQNICGTLAMFMLAFSYARLMRFVPGDFTRGALLLLGVPLLAFFYLSDDLVIYEQSVGPEGFVSFLLAIHITLFVEFLRAREHAFRLRLFTLGFCLTLISILIYYCRPHWGFTLLLPPGIFVLFYPGRLRGTILRRLLPVFSGAVFAAVFIVYPEEHLFRTTDYMNLLERPRGLWAFHGDISVLQLKRELDGLEPSDYSTEVLALAYKAINDELERGKTENPPSFCKYFNWNPDRLFYESQDLRKLHDVFQMDVPKLKAFFMHFFLRGIYNFPGAYFSKIYRQVSGTLSDDGYLYSTGRVAEVHRFRWNILAYFKDYSHFSKLDFGKRYIEEVNADELQNLQYVALSIVPDIGVYYAFMSRQFKWSALLSLVLCIFSVTLCLSGWCSEHLKTALLRLNWLGFASLYLATCSLLTIISVAATHSLCLSRYLDFHQINGLTAQFTGAAYALALTSTLLSHAGSGLWRRLRSKSS